MSTMTEKMSEASPKVPTDEDVGSPKKGERFRCTKCGMSLEVTGECRCEEPSMVHLYCCGHELQKV